MSKQNKQARKPIIRENSGEGIAAPDIIEQMRGQAFPFLLDSAKGRDSVGRHSFIGCDPFMTFVSTGTKITVTMGKEEYSLRGNPIDILRKLMKKYRVTPNKDVHMFQGGVVGMFSYDMHHFFEKIPVSTVDDLNTPDIFLLFVDAMIVFDHMSEKLFIVSTGFPEMCEDKAYARAHERIGFLQNFVDNAKPVNCIPAKLHSEDFQSNFSKESFEEMVYRAKEYIKAGDIFQVNISQRFSVKFSEDPLLLYRILRKINPSPFGCFIDFHDFQVVSSSPERLVKKDGMEVETRPIAGTRPRGKDAKEDTHLSSELSLNEKERAEHIMLVDLERNDMGRICKFGSIHVDDLMTIEEYSHVFHIVSNIRGTTLDNIDSFKVLEACFPGGTITGTPKIRAMEIIDELEPTRRGLYTGSMGYISFNDDMDMNIVIRTFFIKNGRAYIQAGCGIVADSVPQKEYFETIYKAQALLLALGYNESDCGNGL